jgi:hypothetical protein
MFKYDCFWCLCDSERMVSYETCLTLPVAGLQIYTSPRICNLNTNSFQLFDTHTFANVENAYRQETYWYEDEWGNDSVHYVSSGW